MLSFYAQTLNSVEINYTFFRLPLAKTLADWGAQTPPDFRYSFKALRRITHGAKLKDCADLVQQFYTAVSGQLPLGATLFQLPPSLQLDVALLEDFLAVLPDGTRNTFEFRHHSWFNDRVFAALNARNAALCIADSPMLSTPPIATADFGYFRLRNEHYALADIERWAATGTSLAAKTKWQDCYVYFKHEELATGPTFARHFLTHLPPTSTK